MDVQQDIENNAISKWQEVYDLPQQQKIREDCQILAGKLLFIIKIIEIKNFFFFKEKLHPENQEQQLAALSQLESIITYHCKIK